MSGSVLQQHDPAWAREFEALMQAYEEAGGKADILRTPRIASAVISGNRVLATNQIEGVSIETEESESGVRAAITVAPGTKVDHPVHLCFGMIPGEGRQEIISEFEIGADAEIGFLVHCTFPNAVDLEHVMDARVHVGPGATMRYSETHYHGPHGGIRGLPTRARAMSTRCLSPPESVLRRRSTKPSVSVLAIARSAISRSRGPSSRNRPRCG